MKKIFHPLQIPVHSARTPSWSRAPNCNGYRDWINNNTSVIAKHHLLDFIRPGEHPLRVGTQSGTHVFTTHHIQTYRSPENTYYYSDNNGLSQKACSPDYISPGESTHNRAVTHMSICRYIFRRLANRRKSLTPDYPKPDYQPLTQSFSVASPRTSLTSGKLPTRCMNLPMCRQEDYYYCRVRAGFPYTYLRIYILTSDCRLLGDLSSRSHNLTFL